MEWKWSSESSKGRGLKGVAEERKEEESMNDKIMNKEKKGIENEEEEEEEAMDSPLISPTLLSTQREGG